MCYSIHSQHWTQLVSWILFKCEHDWFRKRSNEKSAHLDLLFRVLMLFCINACTYCHCPFSSSSLTCICSCELELSCQLLKKTLKPEELEESLHFGPLFAMLTGFHHESYCEISSSECPTIILFRWTSCGTDRHSACLVCAWINN